jgi:hypothetical protein
MWEFLPPRIRLLGTDLRVAPSVKYHLPTLREEFWKEEEYTYTTRALVEVWSRRHHDEPMPLEVEELAN